MKLLFITQKLHGQDAFTVLWVNGFRKLGYEVTVLCLEWQPEELKKVLDAPIDFNVISMGKETGNTRKEQINNFREQIRTLEYDRVFIHMTPVWMLFGFWYWHTKKIPVYLWYTHYKMQLGIVLFRMFGTRVFCATKQSLPQFGSNPMKVVTGHGIDLSYWPMRKNICDNPMRLLAVNRLSRSKRVEMCIKAMSILPEDYTLDIYGIKAEPEYVVELQRLVNDLHLFERVRFHESVPARDLPALYIEHKYILNMATETIDKTMLEAMTCGCYPITTKANAAAIGIPEAPEKDTPKALADFIAAHTQTDDMIMEQTKMYDVVKNGHSLESLIKKMDSYIRPGN